MAEVKILVVEDEAIVARDVRNTLQNLGYAVPAIASSAKAAIERTAEIQPDLVLMDIVLKGEIDGVEAAKEIRTRFDVPLVYLTAHGDGETLQRAKVTEPFGYVLKPFTDRELASSIEIALYRQRVKRKLRESEERFRKVSELVTDFAYAARVEPEGTFTFEWATEAFVRITGFIPDEVSTRGDLERLVHVDDLPIAILHGETLLAGREDVSELRIVARTGEVRWLRCYGRPVWDEAEGLVVGVYGAGQDITKRKRAEKALRQRAAELAMRNEDLDAFAHTVAHDLQQPLSLILGTVEWLEEGYATMSGKVVQGYLRGIARAGLKMSEIINELLLLAGVDGQAVEMGPLDMARIVADAQQRLALLTEEHQAEVIVPDSWPVALGYSPWVEEVWVNYLSNALKYGGRPPRLELGATTRADGMVCFWVKDNGSGLRPEDQARLFAPLMRFNQTPVAGHGLGLSIVRRIVEKLGGQVGVESDGVPDQGSVFFFTLQGAAHGTNQGTLPTLQWTE